MFGRKNTKNAETFVFDKETYRPVLRCSICMGEQVAGFKEIRTGRFTEVSLIRNERELRKFLQEYGLDTIEKEY